MSIYRFFESVHLRGCSSTFCGSPTTDPLPKVFLLVNGRLPGEVAPPLTMKLYRLLLCVELGSTSASGPRSLALPSS